MTSLLTTMRQRLADAEADAARLREAIQILERAEESPSAALAAAAAGTAAAAAAAGTATPAAAAAARSASAPGSRRRKPAARKSAARTVVPLEKLLKVVGENPGMTTTALAGETGGDQSALLELLKESEQKGEVRREGERRATSWYRVTDEDRIAARAAEIAAQSRTAGANGAKAVPGSRARGARRRSTR